MVKFGLFLVYVTITLSLDIGSGSLNGYFTLDEIDSILQNYSEKYPQVTKDSIGFTFNNISIPVVKLLNPGKPKILVVGGHHARELISMTQVLYVFEQIMQSNLSNHREIWFVPVVNVAGLSKICEMYAENHQIYEIRKNARHEMCSVIQDGVDLNRNYGYKWGYNNLGSSNDPCAEDYRGPFEFSEKETQAMRNLIVSQSFDSVISYHSYGNLYIRPTGYTQISMQALPVPHQLVYNALVRILPSDLQFGSVQELLNYEANGSLMDYLFSLGIFSIEIEIGAENFHSFHPSVVNVPDILLDHLDPFLLIVNKTDSDLSMNISCESDKIKIFLKNSGIAKAQSFAAEVEIEGNYKELSVVSNHNFKIKENRILFNDLVIPSDGREVLIIKVDDGKVTAKVSVKHAGIYQVVDFDSKIDVQVASSHGSLFLVTLVSILVFLILFVLLVFYTMKRSENITFVELEEINPQIPI